MGKKILLATEKPFAKIAVQGIGEIFKKAGYEMIPLESYKTKEDLLKAVAAVDGMIIRSDIVDEAVLAAAASLKIVVRAGAGYDNIDLKAATARGVVAMNTPGQNSNAVAELVFALMLYLARGAFSGKSGSELRGKKIGLQAYGAVGRCVAPIASGFGMEVYAFDPYVKADDIKKDGVIPVKSLEELYTTCDYVSIHIPKTKETYVIELETSPSKRVLERKQYQFYRNGITDVIVVPLDGFKADSDWRTLEKQLEEWLP